MDAIRWWRERRGLGATGPGLREGRIWNANVGADGGWAAANLPGVDEGLGIREGPREGRSRIGLPYNCGVGPSGEGDRR